MHLETCVSGPYPDQNPRGGGGGTINKDAVPASILTAQIAVPVLRVCNLSGHKHDNNNDKTNHSLY